MSSSFSSFLNRPKVSFENVFNSSPIPLDLRSHLVNVYSALCVALLAATAGVIAHMRFNLGGFLSTIATFGMIFYLIQDHDKGNFSRRLAILASIGFFQGCSIGPLLTLAIDVNPTIILSAFLGTAVIFVCFTLSALKAERHQYLALGGLLSSGVSFLFLIALVNLFFRSELMFSVSLYLGLMIFCGYVLYDTQIIVERFRAGDHDFARHALELFVDFIAIFVRIVLILLNNEKKDKRRR